MPESAMRNVTGMTYSPCIWSDDQECKHSVGVAQRLHQGKGKRTESFCFGGQAVNWDILKGNWKQLSGRVKSKWGKLTDDDLTVISGKKDELLGKLQERY